MEDRDYMALALSLAERGVGWASPNPMVGAVIVKDGRIIGQGWHEKCGQPHAERNALAACTEPSQGATIYVTLEPCCHYGRQPPCTQAILESGIRRVVVGSGGPPRGGPNSRPAAAPPVYRYYGWGGYRTGRRSPAHLPHPRRAKPGAHPL